MKRLVAIAAACAVLIVAAAAAARAEDLVAKGKSLTLRHRCQLCHIVDGKGGKIGKPLDGAADRHDVVALRRILTDPQKEFPDAKIKMPKLVWSADDIEAVIAYLQSLKPAPAK